MGVNLKRHFAWVVLFAVISSVVVWLWFGPSPNTHPTQSPQRQVAKRMPPTKTQASTMDTVGMAPNIAMQRVPGTVGLPKLTPIALCSNVVTDLDHLVADARAAMARKAYDKALPLLKAAFTATADADQRMPVGMALYECLIRTRAYEEALALGRELLTLAPSPEERLLLTQQLAALQHRMGKTEEAETLLAQTLANEQDATRRAKYEAQLRGVWRHTPGRTAEVVSNLIDRLSQNPRDEATLRQLGDIYLKSRRDFKAAQPIYEQLATLHPDDQQVQAALLGIYRENEDLAGLRRVYESKLSQAETDDPALHFQIAQVDLQAGRGDEAVAYAEKHLSGANATPFQLQMLSSIYDKAGRKDVAVSALDTAINRETNAQQRISMQFQKADMLTRSKQYAEAETVLRAIIQTAAEDKQTISRAKSEIVKIYEMQGRVSDLNL
jgi:tetratricopeptide (TPR) repeat protein